MTGVFPDPNVMVQLREVHKAFGDVQVRTYLVGQRERGRGGPRRGPVRPTWTVGGRRRARLPLAKANAARDPAAGDPAGLPPLVVEILGAMLVVFFVICLPLTMLSRRRERRLR
jgi:hypothetical protein